MFSDAYPIHSVIEVTVTKADVIKAPSYFLFPDTTEQKQIESAMRIYKVRPTDAKD